MSLRHKTLLLTGFILVALVGTMYVIAVRVLVAGYARAELRETEQRTAEITQLLSQRIDDLDATCHDWSSWDDTYAFVQDGNRAYREANLTISSFSVLGTNLVVYVDLAGRIVYGRWFDFQTKATAPLPQSFQARLTSCGALLEHPHLAEGQRGLLTSPWGLLMVASRPIVDSEKTRPSRGTLIFGRLLGKQELGRLQKPTGLTVQIIPCRSGRLPAHFEDVHARLTTPDAIASQTEGESLVAGYVVLRDVTGQHAGLLRVADSRSIFHRGQRAVGAMLVPAAALGTALSILILLALERLVLFRIAQLSAGVAAVGAGGDLAARVSLAGHDELSGLADRINQTLEALDQSQQRLEEREQQYRALVETTPDWIWQVDENAVYTYASPKVRDTLGYEPETVLGKTPFDLMPPGEAERVREMFRAIAARREPFAGLENACLHADGRVIIVETSGVPILDAAGEFRGYRGVDRDVTDRKRAEAALAAEKERLRVTLRSVGDAVIATDIEGRVSLMSRMAEHLTGWTEPEALGRPIDEVFQVLHGDTREPLPAPMGRVLANGGTASLADRATLISRSGAEYLVADSAAPIFDQESRLVGAVLVFRDVTTEIHLRDEANKAQRLESLGLLAGGIAHDFNNLLTVILGGVQMAQFVNSDPERRMKVLTSAQAACVRAADLTQKLLTFAKGGAPVKEVCALDALVRETVEFALAGSSVELDLSVEPGLWPVEVDPGQISQAVQNLVTNAVQAMPAGGRLHVTLENRPAGWREQGGPLASPQVAIVVRDEGLGIPASHLPRIFDPYFTTKQQGSGLGLTSAYSIVDQHEGTLTVTSQVGVGSTFTICLPSAGPGATVSVGSHPGDLARGSGRILVMDDESSVRDIALMFLREIGYEVQTTPNGEEAIAAYQTALAEERPFDVVILDLTVRGGMGGKETIRLLKEINPRVRAIVCSGYSADLVMRQHRDYGFLGCVGKPFDVAELARVVQQVLCEPLD